MWKGLPSEDCTWKNEQELQHHEMQFLEDRKILGRKDYTPPWLILKSLEENMGGQGTQEMKQATESADRKEK